MLNRLLSTGFLGLLVATLGSGVAFADHHEEGNPCEDSMDNPCGDSMDNPCGDSMDSDDGDSDDGDSGDGGDSADSGDSMESMGSAAWPQQIIMRPLTVPAGVIGASGTLTSSKFDAFGLSLDGAYGISDVLQARAGYGFSLKDFEIKGNLNVGADYSVLRGDGMDLNATVNLGYSIIGESLLPLAAGVNGRYRINDQMAVTYGAHLNIFLEEILGARPIFLSVPVGFAYQVNDNIYASVDTQLAVIEIADSSTGFIGADFLPLNLSGFYSMDNTLDIGAGITIGDLTNEPGENWGIMVMGRKFLGVN